MSKSKMSDANYFAGKIEGKYPFVFFDVGSMGGVPLKWQPFLNNLKVFAFEPDPREFVKLQSTNSIKYLNCALYRSSEDLRFYVARGHGKSSILRPNLELVSKFEEVDRFEIVDELIIPSSRVKSLDMVMDEEMLADADFIKLDTQGSELPILQGGQKNFISNIFGTEIEVEFAEIYENQSCFSDVDQFMCSKGFQLIDLRRQYWKRKDYYNYPGKGQLIFGDALYFKRIDHFLNELIKRHDWNYSMAKIKKAIFICLVYRIFDYAVALVKNSEELGIISDREGNEMIDEIKIYSSMPIRPERDYIREVYRFLRSSLNKIILKRGFGWSNSDSEIGNVDAI